jgi:hypothetical protein
VWKPIESAPKNGDELIGFRPDQGVFVFRWALMEEFVAKDMHGDPIEDYDEDQADWWHDRWGWMEDELRPTHWMPLPDPPTVKADAPCPGAGLNPRHEWFYDHHRAGMLCGKCGQFVSDMT